LQFTLPDAQCIFEIKSILVDTANPRIILRNMQLGTCSDFDVLLRKHFEATKETQKEGLTLGIIYEQWKYLL